MYIVCICVYKSVCVVCYSLYMSCYLSYSELLFVVDILANGAACCQSLWE